MPSSLRMTDLPVATRLNSTDIFLVSDLTNQAAKKINLRSLNSELSLKNLSDYNNYLVDIETINDTLDMIIGDGTVVHSLSDIDELIADVGDSVESVRRSLSGVINTLRENVEVDILNRNQMDSAVVEKVNDLEMNRIRAGLASGSLFVTHFKGG